ncbi:MAG: ROK family protein [Kiritimatiellaceae bacterium]|nr:ROK family protein [Kiritimatiellaceae bacterium]
MNFLGIDIGGTKIAVSIGDEQGKIIADRRFPTNPESVQDTMQQAAQVAEELIAAAGLKGGQIAAIGITSPAPMCSKRRMILKTPNLRGWEPFAVGDFFEEKFKRPTFMQNDANGAGLAEFWFGACKGLDLIYLTMSTGIGAGIICNGQLVAGTNDLAGEVGHITLDLNGPRCGCGKTGCWEAYCGGKNFADQVRADIAKGAQTSILKEAGGDPAKISMQEIRAAIRAGDPYACKKWEGFIEKMAHAVSILLQTLNPQAIVMGTLAIHGGDTFIPQMMERLPKYAWKGVLETCSRIEASVLTNIGELAAIAVAIDGTRQLNKG